MNPKAWSDVKSRLPWSELVDDLPNTMVQVDVILSLAPCVAQEALLLFQMGDDAESLGVVDTASRRCLEPVFSADQQVAGGGVTTALLARVEPRIYPLLGTN